MSSRPPTPAHDAAGDPGTTGSVTPTRGRPVAKPFSVAFTSPMRDSDLDRLARTLNLATHMRPKLHDSLTSPGVVRLDFYSRLFLQRGPTEGQWVLEGRTWGDPSQSIVHDWHRCAAAAAHRLDPSVAFPSRLTTTSPPMPTRPLGRAANKRLARIGRHILGLQ
jgi:hypothetical protein